MDFVADIEFSDFKDEENALIYAKSYYFTNFEFF
jgi:hypothetical protein